MTQGLGDRKKRVPKSLIGEKERPSSPYFLPPEKNSGPHHSKTPLATSL
jgi:hypothetical protein